MTGINDDNQESTLDQAVQQFVDARLRGEEPDIDEFVKQYPEFEHQIREKFRNLQKINALFNSLVQADESDFQDAMVGQELVGSQIGQYKLLSVVSEGGMGIVYLAEQAKPIRRRVALKVIKPGMDSKRVIARFEAERQALALMDHPNIAQVHDAGTTETGRPYFAMEHVKGVPITEHCDRHKLTIEERLKLFLQVCEAVQHAHQKGIIHRDIKPTNIMVSIEVNKSVPKIIDFGVAKALSQPLTERTLVTEQGLMLGTPEYMSPEQAEMTGEDIDTRSDIYSLGVLLYELLTGVLPFESEALRKGGVNHVRKMICEEEPKTPSTRLSLLSHEKTTEMAKNRRSEPGVLQRRLRGDLDWITLKAMEKDRTRRYASVGEFSTDIIRHLNNEPVVAGPPSTLYRAKKFMRRNCALVAGIVAVMVVFIAGVVVSTLFAFGQARARAEAEAVSDFLLYSVIDSLSLWRTRGRGVTIRSVLDAASQSLEGELTDRPLVEASIRRELGCAYIFLGSYEEAERHFQRVFEIYRAEVGTEHQETLISMWHVGWVYWWQGRLDEAEQMLTKALQGMEVVLNEDNENRLYCMAVLAWVYNGQGRFNEAEHLFAKGRGTVRRVLSEEHEYSPTFMNGLAFAYQMQGRYDEAEQLFKEALKLSRRVRGEQDMETLGLMNNLGNLYHDQGRYDEAEQLLVKALDGQRHVFGEQHLMTFQTMNSLAVLYHSQGQHEQAKELLTKSLKVSSRTLGDEHPVTLESKNDLAMLYKEQARYEEAEPLLVEAVEGRRLKLGDTHPHTLESWKNLIELYEAWGKPEKAEEWRTRLLQTEAIKE
jgi:serine/threonine protein kinase/tetratricopeptide (TPR) repeat protein